jgi:hypothetical protein
MILNKEPWPVGYQLKRFLVKLCGENNQNILDQINLKLKKY